MYLSMVCGMFVCVSLSINVCMFTVSNALFMLLFLLFLIAARTCSVVMFICVGCRLSTFLVIFLFVVFVL